MPALYMPLCLFSMLKSPALGHLLQKMQLSLLLRSHLCLKPLSLVICFYLSFLLPLFQALSHATTVVIFTLLLSVPRIATPWRSPALTILALPLFGPVMPVSTAGNKLPSFHLWTLLVALSLQFVSTSSQEVPGASHPQSPLTLPLVCK